MGGDIVSHMCLKGAKAICEAVGENPKHIMELVRDFGLPAWKRDVRGTWRALPDDLHLWLREQRDIHINDYRYKHYLPDARTGKRAE